MMASAECTTDIEVRHREFGASLFEELRQMSEDGRGVTRPSYSPEEDAAHGILKRIAGLHGLEVYRDWAANLFITLPGVDRTLPAVMTGSHVDTVPVGGNYDGAAGVVAGLSVLCRWAACGYRPLRDTTLIVTRAEESVWFPVSYIGSRTAFNLLSDDDLRAERSDTGRSLRAHMRESGADLTPDRRKPLDAQTIANFVELHIEQGPVLIEEDAVIGVVSAICGSMRYRHASVIGRYAHSGATPRSFRADAVVAMSEFVVAMTQYWEELESAGKAITLTFGVCSTENGIANFSAVAGNVFFALDVRGVDIGLFEEVEQHLRSVVTTIEARHNVRFDLGARTGSMPAIMDAGLQDKALRLSRSRHIPAITMVSGAGHDAATFAGQGVPTLMLFVRNANGSHNPDESLDMQDFARAATILDELLECCAEEI